MHCGGVVVTDNETEKAARRLLLEKELLALEKLVEQQYPGEKITLCLFMAIGGDKRTTSVVSTHESHEVANLVCAGTTELVSRIAGGVNFDHLSDLKEEPS